MCNTTSEEDRRALGLWLWLTAVLALGAVQVQAQTTGYDVVFGEGADVVLTDAGRFHVTLHSQGAGVGFQRGTFDGAFSVRGWQGELVFVRHLKEEKTRNPVYEEGLPYVYGKVNAFHALRLQRYKESIVAEKYRRGGVTVSHTRSLGAVLGISKPVFLEIGYPEIPYTSLQVERYEPEEHFSDRIYGRAPWVNGLEILSWNPGVSLGQTVSFEFSETRTSTRILDVGMHADVYWSPVEIMAAAFVEPRRVQFTFLLRYAWGAQWSAKGLGDARS